MTVFGLLMALAFCLTASYINWRDLIYTDDTPFKRTISITLLALLLTACRALFIILYQLGWG